MEFITGRLLFMLNTSFSEVYEERYDDLVINLDDLYQHTKVRKHFGPPSLKIIWKHCEEVNTRLRKYNRVVFLTNSQNDNLHIERRTLSSFLMGCYGVLVLHWDAEKVNEILLTSLPARLAFFRDYHGDSSYKLNILDCLRGLQIGCISNNWFSSLAFTKYPHATNGHLDMNWVIPGQIIAFKDPTVNREKDNRTISKSVIRELKRCGIRVIVRLNGNDHNTNIEYYGKSYLANDFKKEQFFHYEIPFKDVGTPSTAQAHQFVSLCERYGDRIAVHCHAGLGRTATMIGCYLIKNYGFDSRSACGWLKLCRRGSVMGPQHFFLDKYNAEIENGKNISHTADSLSKLSVETLLPDQLLLQSGGHKTRISRSPRKNNIIHIAPVNIRQRKQDNPMHKYKSGAEPGDNIRDKVLQKSIQRQKQTRPLSNSDQRQANSTQTPERKAKLSVSRPTSKKNTIVVPKQPSKESVPTTAKRPRKSVPRLCYSKPANKSETKIEGMKSQNRRGAAPMNRSNSKEKNVIDSKKSRTGSRNQGIIYSSSNWGQWSGKIIEGLVSQSKSRINELINNVYSKQTFENE